MAMSSSSKQCLGELPVLIDSLNIRRNNGVYGFDISMTTTTTTINSMMHHDDDDDEDQVVNEGAKNENEVAIIDGDHTNGEGAKHDTGNMPPPQQQLPVSPAAAAAAAAAEEHNYTHRSRTSSSHSQPIRVAQLQTSSANSAKPKDRRFDTFKTWSGRLERKVNSFSQNQRQDGGGEEETRREQDDFVVGAQISPDEINVDRYFDALEGPELDTLRVSEKSILPEDEKWPFLLRFPISSFGICLGVSSQANMWKALSTAPSTRFLHVSRDVNLVLWLVSAALVTAVAILYALKAAFYFEAVRREYYHPVRVNFFFAPWIALLFLVLGVPPHFTEAPLHESVWYVLMAPIFCLELKIYGQWMSGGQRRLSKVANPSNHLSVVGNFVGALVGATMGLKEGPLFFFAVGLAHYTVLFVTLYQRLPTNVTLPKELHPVFFLFVAAPSIASMAWAKIEGSFGVGSKIAYFVALFLYMSLAVRVNFFRGFKFSVAWWAYTFPTTGAAVATIRYSSAVTTTTSRWLMLALCGISTLTVTALLVTTIVHAFVLRDLFPNDSAIAISDQKRHHHRRKGSGSGSAADHKDTAIDQYLKFVDDSAGVVKDLEAANNA